ncbi:Cyclic nucleotide-binding protein [Pseudocohnilembus persalinus]|uniref:Cyclic nucleotide-binding protein n=1 Tax=Pseudocohnilembus persalinus TaxID=266149 RepID=A0A0V0QTQ4_PSEPJ|nr:Cyclic nucleotide-binding protein [Pseudocohnilembus persalinus]|eukprot:KRX05575.1 Cyclic nucleotide-binding protein [Pseudocohnilembus persalinus]
MSLQNFRNVNKLINEKFLNGIREKKDKPLEIQEDEEEQKSEKIGKRGNQLVQIVQDKENWIKDEEKMKIVEKLLFQHVELLENLVKFPLDLEIEKKNRKKMMESLQLFEFSQGDFVYNVSDYFDCFYINLSGECVVWERKHEKDLGGELELIRQRNYFEDIKKKSDNKSDIFYAQNELKSVEKALQIYRDEEMDNLLRKFDKNHRYATLPSLVNFRVVKRIKEGQFLGEFEVFSEEGLKKAYQVKSEKCYMLGFQKELFFGLFGRQAEKSVYVFGVLKESFGRGCGEEVLKWIACQGESFWLERGQVLYGGEDKCEFFYVCKEGELSCSVNSSKYRQNESDDVQMDKKQRVSLENDVLNQFHKKFTEKRQNKDKEGILIQTNTFVKDNIIGIEDMVNLGKSTQKKGQNQQKNETEVFNESMNQCVQIFGGKQQDSLNKQQIQKEKKKQLRNSQVICTSQFAHLIGISRNMIEIAQKKFNDFGLSKEIKKMAEIKEKQIKQRIELLLKSKDKADQFIYQQSSSMQIQPIIQDKNTSQNQSQIQNQSQNQSQVQIQTQNQNDSFYLSKQMSSNQSELDSSWNLMKSKNKSNNMLLKIFKGEKLNSFRSQGCQEREELQKSKFLNTSTLLESNSSPYNTSGKKKQFKDVFNLEKSKFRFLNNENINNRSVNQIINNNNESKEELDKFQNRKDSQNSLISNDTNRNLLGSGNHNNQLIQKQKSLFQINKQKSFVSGIQDDIKQIVDSDNSETEEKSIQNQKLKLNNSQEKQREFYQQDLKVQIDQGELKNETQQTLFDMENDNQYKNIQFQIQGEQNSQENYENQQKKVKNQKDQQLKYIRQQQILLEKMERDEEFWKNQDKNMRIAFDRDFYLKNNLVTKKKQLLTYFKNNQDFDQYGNSLNRQKKEKISQVQNQSQSQNKLDFQSNKEKLKNQGKKRENQLKQRQIRSQEWVDNSEFLEKNGSFVKNLEKQQKQQDQQDQQLNQQQKKQEQKNQNNNKNENKNKGFGFGVINSFGIKEIGENLKEGFIMRNQQDLQKIQAQVLIGQRKIGKNKTSFVNKQQSSEDLLLQLEEKQFLKFVNSLQQNQNQNKSLQVNQSLNESQEKNLNQKQEKQSQDQKQMKGFLGLLSNFNAKMKSQEQLKKRLNSYDEFNNKTSENFGKNLGQFSNFSKKQEEKVSLEKMDYQGQLIQKQKQIQSCKNLGRKSTFFKSIQGNQNKISSQNFSQNQSKIYTSPNFENKSRKLSQKLGNQNIKLREKQVSSQKVNLKTENQEANLINTFDNSFINQKNGLSVEKQKDENKNTIQEKKISQQIQKEDDFHQNQQQVQKIYKRKGFKSQSCNRILFMSQNQNQQQKMELNERKELQQKQYQFQENKHVFTRTFSNLSQIYQKGKINNQDSKSPEKRKMNKTYSILNLKTEIFEGNISQINKNCQKNLQENDQEKEQTQKQGIDNNFRQMKSFGISLSPIKRKQSNNSLFLWKNGGQFYQKKVDNLQGQENEIAESVVDEMYGLKKGVQLSRTDYGGKKKTFYKNQQNLSYKDL